MSDETLLNAVITSRPLLVILKRSPYAEGYDMTSLDPELSDTVGMVCDFEPRRILESPWMIDALHIDEADAPEILPEPKAEDIPQ